MASPRIQVPASGQGSTGNPVLDSANAVGDPSGAIALEGSRPAQSTPLRSSTTAADLDTALPSLSAGQGAPTASSSASPAGHVAARDGRHEQPQAHSDGVENVLTAIGGAAVTAPLAALEAIGHKVPDLVNTVKAHIPHSTASTSTPSSSSNTAGAGGETLLSQAQQLAAQATQYASSGVHQIVEKLPENITSHLPEQIKNLGVAPVQAQRAATGEKAFDFTQPHTTANFEASGSLQSTKNPAIVEAQSDLAVKAESGDL